MSLSSSVHALGEVLKEDQLFQKIGRPKGWYFRFHYAARFRDHLRLAHPWEEVSLSSSGMDLRFVVSSPYLGSFKGVFLDREYDCSTLIKFKPRNLLDLGANIGFGTVFFSTLFPGCQFASVEPDPRNLEHLRTNLRLNGIASEIIEAAAGPREGTLALRYGENPTCSSLDGTGLHVHDSSVAVSVQTVPAILRRLGWSSVDILKVDIEGAEEALLSEDAEWLANVRVVLIEVHPNTTPERISALLGAHGFKMTRLGSGREPVYFAARELE